MNTTTTTPTTITTTITNATLTITAPTGESLTIFADKLSPEIQHAAMMHGLKQKIADAAAISRNPATGRSATMKEKFAAMGEIVTRLQCGEWNKPRATGAGTSTGGLLFRAMYIAKPGKTSEEIRGFLAARSKEELSALRKTPAIAAIIADLRVVDTAAGDIDGNDLLADF